MVSLQLPKSAKKEKPRLFYGMYLFIKIIIQRCLYVNKDDHQKKEKFMNINLPDHSLYAAFCHAIRSCNKRTTESLTFGNKFCKIFSYYEFLFQLVFTPVFERRHIPRYKYEGDIGVYGVAVLDNFSCGISVISISTYGIAVLSRSSVCGF